MLIGFGSRPALAHARQPCSGQCEALCPPVACRDSAAARLAHRVEVEVGASRADGIHSLIAPFPSHYPRILPCQGLRRRCIALRAATHSSSSTVQRNSTRSITRLVASMMAQSVSRYASCSCRTNVKLIFLRPHPHSKLPHAAWPLQSSSPCSPLPLS